MSKAEDADGGSSPLKILEAEFVERIKRELRREALPQSDMTTSGIGHNRGPPFESESLALSVPEAGKLLGLSRNGAYGAAQRGELPTVRIGSRIFVPRRALDELLNSAAANWRRRQEERASAR
jgi:excisionase family DNA binding protein